MSLALIVSLPLRRAPYSASIPLCHCSLSDLDLIQAWCLANVTENRELLDICLPHIERRINVVIRDRQFFYHTDVHHLAELLFEVSDEWLSEEAKVTAIATWMDAPGPGNEARDERPNFFNDLLALLDVAKLSPRFMDDLTLDKGAVKLPAVCKNALIEAWKGSHVGESSTTRTSLQYAACVYPLPLFSNLTTLPSQTFVFSPQERIFVFAQKVGSGLPAILSTLEHYKQAAVRRETPSRKGSSVVMLEGI